MQNGEPTTLTIMRTEKLHFCHKNSNDFSFAKKKGAIKALKGDTNDGVRCYKCRKLDHRMVNGPLL